jgi:hypothetical protein
MSWTNFPTFVEFVRERSLELLLEHHEVPGRSLFRLTEELRERNQGTNLSRWSFKGLVMRDLFRGVVGKSRVEVKRGEVLTPTPGF